MAMPTPLDFVLLWVASLLTLFVFSFLYKDNPFYKFAEYLYVGVSAGYFIAYDFQNNLIPNLWVPLTKGQWEYLFALVLGLLLITRFFPKIANLSRWSMSYMIGIFTGLGMVTITQSDFINQIGSTILPVVGIPEAEGGLWQGIQNLLLIVGVCTAIIYFYFSKEHKGFLGGTARLGIWFLMVSFGASFGFTIMARISLLIGRVDYLREWVQKTLMVFGMGS